MSRSQLIRVCDAADTGSARRTNPELRRLMARWGRLPAGPNQFAGSLPQCCQILALAQQAVIQASSLSGRLEAEFAVEEVAKLGVPLTNGVA